MRLSDYLAPALVLTACTVAGKLVFLGFGPYLEAEWASPLNALQYVVFGAFPFALAATIVARVVTGRWPWRSKIVSNT